MEILEDLFPEFAAADMFAASFRLPALSIENISTHKFVTL